MRSAGFLCLSYRRGVVIGHSAEVPVSLLVGAGFLASDIQGLVFGRSREFQPGPSRVITRLFSWPYIHCAPSASIGEVTVELWQIFSP